MGGVKYANTCNELWYRKDWTGKLDSTRHALFTERERLALKMEKGYSAQKVDRICQDWAVLDHTGPRLGTRTGSWALGIRSVVFDGRKSEL